MSFELKGINHQYLRGNTDRREFLGKLTTILGSSAVYLGISGLAAAQENSSEAEKRAERKAERENGSSGERSRRKGSSGEGRRR
jgi:hypothetical protein